MPADARREPPSEARHGHGRPPDGPPDEGSWAFARGFRSLLGWSPSQAAPALPPLTASGLRAQSEAGHHDGGVHRPTAPSSGARRPNVVAQPSVPAAAQEGGLDQPTPAPLRSGAVRPVTITANTLAARRIRGEHVRRFALKKNNTTSTHGTLTPIRNYHIASDYLDGRLECRAV